MLQLENKCQNLEAQIKKFHRKFNNLHQQGLPDLQGIGGQLIPLEYYQHMLHEIAADKTKFTKIWGIITGKAFIEGLDYDLFIQHGIKRLFLTRLTFGKCTNVDESYRKLINISIPDDKR